jgi:hypothetical protein
MYVWSDFYLVPSPLMKFQLPPTPPTTPSTPSIPFFSVIPTHLEQLVQNIPVNPPDQLPWLLNVIMESIKYCQ